MTPTDNWQRSHEVAFKSIGITGTSCVRLGLFLEDRSSFLLKSLNTALYPVLQYVPLGTKVIPPGLVLLLITFAPLAAKDIAVLIDVYRTMANYGAWQEEAKRLTWGILSGHLVT